LVDICGYEVPTNLISFTQKELTEVKIFQKVLGGYFHKHVYCNYIIVVKTTGIAFVAHRMYLCLSLLDTPRYIPRYCSIEIFFHEF